MKEIILLFIAISSFYSCSFKNGNPTIQNEIDSIPTDTILTMIDNSISNEFYSKSYNYFWITRYDTLDFRINVKEGIKDSSLTITFCHKNPILFSKAINNAKKCIPLINQDFRIEKLKIIYVNPPIFYKDLNEILSSSYEKKFGAKSIESTELNEFLKESWMNEQLTSLIERSQKKVRRYSIEKFHILTKEHYGDYLPFSEFKGYPSFSIHGMNIGVILE